jgi:oligosaccharide repeat unit polymerase
MILGELIGKSIVFSSVINRKCARNYFLLGKTYFVVNDISRMKTSLLFIFCMIVDIWAIQEFLTNARIGGYSGENLMNYARMVHLNDDVQTNYLLVISKYAVNGLGYYSLFKVIPLLSNGRLWRLNKNKFFYIASILSLLLLEILSTGRVGFIRFFQITLFLIILSRRFLIHEKIIFFGKFLKYVIVLGSLFFMIFFLLGILRNPDFFSDGWKSFSIYFGSPFPALNEWLRSYELSKSFGLESFKAVRNLLVRFGINVREPLYFQPSISFPNGDSTNIYSALMHYIKDFNIAGCYIVYFFQGLFFSVFFYYILNKRKYNLWVLVFSYFAYDIVLQIAAAGFLASYLGVTHSFVLLFIILSYLFLNPKQTYSVNTIKKI